MGQRPTDDGLASAYVTYLATWLHSWPFRRRLVHRRRRDAAVRRALAREAHLRALSLEVDRATQVSERLTGAS